MTKIEQMKSLIQELNAASNAYYGSGETIMSDAEFDSKLMQLKKLEEETNTVFPNSPVNKVGGSVLKDIKEITHETPMLSLQKCHSTEEVIQFSNHKSLVASVKLDGISCRLIYINGELIRAESRGNGINGNDITQHVKQFQNVPLHIDKPGKYVIDGEALIKLDDFNEINKNGEYKNSRNLAAGTLSTLDTSVVKNRKMSWYAWEVVEGYKDTNSFYLNFLEASQLGFDVVPFAKVEEFSKDTIKNVIDKFLKVAEEKCLPQDGIVFKFDDVKYGKSLGNTDHHFRNGIAFKGKNNDVITTLKDIEFTMGKTGILTPTAVFDPVECDGSVIERASLHNISIMREIMGKPFKGQKMAVFKANLIIPNVRWAEQFDSSKYDDVDDMILNMSYINIPQTCPICGEPTKIVKENESEVLWCTNPDCKGKLLGKLSHAVSKDALNIDGLSEATIEKFISLGWLSSIKDVYYLKCHEKQMKILEGFGQKSVKKLLDAIENSRKVTLDHFLYSLSIPLLGKTASKSIAKAENYDLEKFIQDMIHPGAKCFSHISGIGNSIIKSMDDYFDKECSKIYELSKEFIFETPKPIFKMAGDLKNLTGQTYVITGSLHHFPNRDALKERIESMGGKVSGSISKNTTALINNDIQSTSSKNQKAKSLGVPIISEDEFLSRIS